MPLLLLVLAMACSGGAGQGAPDKLTPLIGADGVYTLVNLHPDDVRSKLYAVNYQQQGLIPMCTPVELVALKGNRLTFNVLETGRTYAYDYHKAAVEPFPQHLERYFGPTCDEAAVSQLGPTDREGIKAGKAMRGMTKEGVIFAIGYPPPHRTPSLEDSRWLYWQARFKTMAVVFDEQDVVTRIER
ncbi:MAG: hypothetical protein ABFS46_09105 [Myxococcota bacterium]